MQHTGDLCCGAASSEHARRQAGDEFVLAGAQAGEVGRGAANATGSGAQAAYGTAGELGDEAGQAG